MDTKMSFEIIGPFLCENQKGHSFEIKILIF